MTLIDEFTTLSCVRQLVFTARRETVQYYLRQQPICITMLTLLVVFNWIYYEAGLVDLFLIFRDGIKPLTAIRTGVP